MEPPFTEDELARQIVRESQDAIVAADRDGNVILWNAGAERIFGHGAGEVVGRPLDFMIPEPMRARHWEGYRKVMESGRTKYGKDTLGVPALRKDGSRISVEFTVVLLHDPEGRPAGVAALMRDVTARWLREQEMKKKLAALPSS